MPKLIEGKSYSQQHGLQYYYIKAALSRPTLVSTSQIFELGFFTPNGSENQYVGIWYKNLMPSKIVWVANRYVPLMYTDGSAKLAIGSDGNLKLMDGQQNIVWSTNVSGLSNFMSATLLDNGNFVLQDANYTEIWGSFEDPTDTILPSMKIKENVRTGVKQYLISWRSDSDPSPGSFSTGVSLETPTQAFTWNGSTPYWRGGQWDKSKFIGIEGMDQSYLSGYNVQQNIQLGTTYFWIDIYNSSFFGYMFISPGGSLKIKYWDDRAKAWLTSWAGPNNTCEIYGTCGPFGVCKSLNSPICKCIDGFVPKSNEEWNNGNWTGGCVRETELNCLQNTSTSPSTNVKKDAFWTMSQMKLPDSEDLLSDIEDQEGCLSWCLNNCSCSAYSYHYGCLVWTKDLIDLQEFRTVGVDLFVRVAYVKAVVFHITLHPISGGSSQKVVSISLSTVAGIMFFAAFVFGLYKWRAKKKGTPENLGELVQGNAWKEQLKQDDSLDLTLFSFDSILLATNKFSMTSKLGQGGFGSVYKGKLNDGKEVAVKRLSSSSAQGVEEFKNEIVLISKLQHRNLVKLTGCCIEGEEKILVYEIIHRDLKVSNILSDEKMNPKISDFGLARMFEGTQVLVNTHKIVGTLFGVLLLEIVRGKKNTALYDQGQYLNLLSYAWHLWSEGKALDLLDEAIAVSSPLEVTRCIRVGLLCVQDHAINRPNMSDVVLMLSSESDLPQPRQPTFTFQTKMPNGDIPSQQESIWSVNTVTTTMVEGR
ncbi:LOW QUALITY PROTEIN: hypothetical protein BT93_C0995 [Corymbia citriodora subsp. variegata]|nr:LOW QUALITY PROTEIN: hypothetical protein BT93_C0995 [Corymbia citriodora subsp. variegata]